MKKHILVYIVLFLLTATGMCSADFQGSEWAYEVLSDGTVMITAYKGIGGEVIIPEKIDGHSVSALAFDVFWFNEEITSVEIPESLTKIGDYAFLMENQKWLDSYRDNGKPFILIPEAARILVDYFAAYADEVHINPFLGCYRLETISASPDNPVFSVIDSLLINKISYETVSYPAGRQETVYTVPEGITSIGFQTFFGSCLESVSLPDSLIEIKQNPFIFCVNMKEISVSEKNEGLIILDGALVSKNGILIAYPMNSDAAAYTVPQGITVIGDGAFFGSMSLQKIILSEGVTTVGDRAFDHCEVLKSAVLPEGLISIESAAFKNCESLEEINLPGTLTYIDDMAFYNVGKQLLFTVEKNTYGALWTAVQEYRYHFPGEPEKKSRLTKVYESLLDENGEISKLHLRYRAERVATGRWLTRDVYIANGVTYIEDENEENGVSGTLYKENVLYTLFPDSKTGKSEEDAYWYFEMDGVINEAKNLFRLICSHTYRSDYTGVTRVLGDSPFFAEVFPEYRYGPEIAFYFDQDGKLVYCYEEKYNGISPAGYGKGKLLFTIYELTKDFDESIFDISDYEITRIDKKEPIHISDGRELMEFDISK